MENPPSHMRLPASHRRPTIRRLRGAVSSAALSIIRSACGGGGDISTGDSRDSATPVDSSASGATHDPRERNVRIATS